MSTDVLLVGWAEKEGSRRKNWKRRYFLLRTAHPAEIDSSGATHTLLYFKTEGADFSRQPTGAVAIIRGTTTIEPVTRKIKGVPRQCLVIRSPNRVLVLRPEHDFPTWAATLAGLQPPSNAAELRRSTIGDRPVEAVTREGFDMRADEEAEAAGADGADLAVSGEQLSMSHGLLSALSEHGKIVHPDDHSKAALAPEEEGRIPMLARGVTLAFLRFLVNELNELGRGDIDCGQFLNGVHTTSSETDWKEFSRLADPLCGKACTLHTGTSFVETCIAHRLTEDPETGAPFFGKMNTFVSYTWRGDGITLANLVAAVEETLATEQNVGDIEQCIFFVDVFVCAQHRGVRPRSNTCPNATDVGMFEPVVNECTRLVLYCTPLTKPKSLTRVWCLYEIMSALKRTRPVIVALSALDRAELRRLLYDDFDKLLSLFTTIRSAEAEATFEADKSMVFGWITRDLGENGFHELDQIVAKEMRLWLVHAAKTLVQEKQRSDEAQTIATGRLMHECSRLLVVLARFEDAESLSRDANEIYKNNLRPDHPDTAMVLNNLADIYRYTGRLREAVDLYRQVLATLLADPGHGQNHKRTVGVMSNLALGLKDIGALNDAAAMAQHAISSSTAVNGPDHADTGIAIDTLAQVMLIAGRFNEAAQLFQAVLAISEKVHGLEHPNVGLVVGNLAAALQSGGDVHNAAAMFRRALSIMEAAFGLNHPRTGVAASNLGTVLRDLGELDEAEIMHRRAVAIDEATNGPRGSGNALNNLAAVLYDKKQTDEASLLFGQVLEKYEATLGPDHLTTITTRSNVAGCFRDSGKLEQALALYRDVQGAFERIGAPDHPFAVYTAGNIGRTLMLGRETHPWIVKISKWLAETSTS